MRIHSHPRWTSCWDQLASDSFRCRAGVNGHSLQLLLLYCKVAIFRRGDWLFAALAAMSDRPSSVPGQR